MSDGPDLNDFLCFAIYSTESSFSRAYRALLEPLGLTYAQYLVMAVLWEADGRTVSEIGERLFLDSSTLSPLLKRLEAMGNVQRRRDAEDERVVRVTLTERGRALGRQAKPIPLAIAGVSGMSFEELRRLKKDVERLRTALQAASLSADQLSSAVQA
jgi:DNA-binding MarR family transcriptional regulator